MWTGKVVNIRPKGGSTDGKYTYLSRSILPKVDLWSSDDGSGRQKWVIETVGTSAKGPVVHIKTIEGERKHCFMSCDEHGGKVNLWTEDDNSGRQKWVLHDLGNGLYNILPEGGTNDGILSCSADGYANLCKEDDGSGRQQWSISLTSAAVDHWLFPPDVLMNIQPREGSTDPKKTVLSRAPPPETRVDLWSEDDHTGRQRWKIIHLHHLESGEGVVVNIVVVDGERPEAYLSCHESGGKVDLWKEDDGTGRQRWIVRPVGHDLYNILPESGATGFLSCSQDGHVSLWKEDDGSGRQQWHIIPAKLT